MNESSVLIGVLPLVLFAIVDSFGGLKTALISAALLAVLEVGFTIIVFGELDYITGLSVGLILLMAWASYTKKTSKFFRMQPAVLSFVLGTVFLIGYMMGHEIIYEMFEKYKVALPDEMKLKFSHPLYIQLFKKFSFHAFWGLYLHAAICWYAAVKLNNFWWVTTRIVGFYVCLALPMFFSALRISGRI